MLVRLTIVAGFSGEPKGLTGREKDQEEEEQQHNTNVHAGVSGAHEGDAQSSEDVTEDKRDLNEMTKMSQFDTGGIVTETTHQPLPPAPEPGHVPPEPVQMCNKMAAPCNMLPVRYAAMQELWQSLLGGVGALPVAQLLAAEAREGAAVAAGGGGWRRLEAALHLSECAAPALLPQGRRPTRRRVVSAGGNLRAASDSGSGGNGGGGNGGEAAARPR